jgi:uncharacterized membrane protein YdjX (TVP38/TMEM64 family)
LLKVQVRDATWLTGSNYGPEGGLVSTVAIVGAGICLFLSTRIRISERMKELVFGPSVDAAANAAVHLSLGPDPGEDGPI